MRVALLVANIPTLAGPPGLLPETIALPLLTDLLPFVRCADTQNGNYFFCLPACGDGGAGAESVNQRIKTFRVPQAGKI